MNTKEEIEHGLKNFYGTEQYHRWSILFKKHLLTDGVKWLCDNADCYWLADAIASYHATCMKDRSLRDFQFWSLKAHDDKSATLTCERDQDDVVITQKIPYTDFPLPEIQLWVEPTGDGQYVIMLPSEH